MLPIEVGPINPSGRGGRGLVPLHWPDMRLKLDDPSAAGDLVSFLNARPDCVAAETGRGVVEVNILGSQRLPFMRLELDLRLGAWRVANPGVGVVLVTG